MTFRLKPLTHEQAVLNGRKAGRRSGQLRAAAARQRAVQAAAEAIRLAGQGAPLVDVLCAFYAKAYEAGRQAQGVKALRERGKASEAA
jgi:hypothetical protein